ncbi:MAG: hypothetical protein J5819_05835, partial [Eubacterium sp.]|nr:hypothetical protein [Eubacterium sp.]
HGSSGVLRSIAAMYSLTRRSICVKISVLPDVGAAGFRESVGISDSEEAETIRSCGSGEIYVSRYNRPLS